MKFLLQKVWSSQIMQLLGILLGIFLSFQYLMNVVKILTISLTILSIGLKIVYLHEPTKKALGQLTNDLIQHFTDSIAAYCIKYATSQQLEEITTSVIKITAGFHRISKAWSGTPSCSPAVLDSKYLNISFNFEGKQWELKVPFNKIHRRSPERPYIKYTTGERFEFPNHHPAIDFYYTDLSEAATECTYGME